MSVYCLTDEEWVSNTRRAQIVRREGNQMYGITAPKTHGNYHVSEIIGEILDGDDGEWTTQRTPICGAKSYQRNSAWFKPQDIRATLVLFIEDIRRHE